MTNDLDSVILR